MTNSSPSALKGYVASELQRLREASGLKRDAVAKQLHCNLSHVTHLEIARNLPRASEVRDLLELYGVKDRIDAFIELVDSARRGRDWWEAFRGDMPRWFDRMLGLESSAHRIEGFDNTVVRGLFQTPDYCTAVIEAAGLELTPSEINERVTLRMRRQDILTSNKPTVWSIMDESVLRRAPKDANGAPDEGVLAEQVEHLIKQSELPNVNLQILPFSAGIHAASDGGTFTVFTPGPEWVGHPGTVYSENQVGGQFVDEADDILVYRNAFQRLQVEALTPKETRVFLTRRLKELSS